MDLQWTSRRSPISDWSSTVGRSTEDVRFMQTPVIAKLNESMYDLDFTLPGRLIRVGSPVDWGLPVRMLAVQQNPPCSAFRNVLRRRGGGSRESRRRNWTVAQCFHMYLHHEDFMACSSCPQKLSVWRREDLESCQLIRLICTCCGGTAVLPARESRVFAIPVSLGQET
jgi:hypothetical protein